MTRVFQQDHVDTSLNFWAGLKIFIRWLERGFKYWVPAFAGMTALVFLMIGGCGFHLRGGVEIPNWAKVMILQSDTPYGRFEVQLKRALTASGVEFVKEPKLAAVVLQILSQSTDRKIVTLGSDARAQDFQLTYTVKLQLLDKTQKELLAPTLLSQNRQFTFDKATVLGKSEEEILLFADMRRELVYQALQIIRGALLAGKS